MPTPLLTTKLYIPPLHPKRVSRPRLIQRLDEGLDIGHRLTLVSAPAGYGKTTLLSEWVSTVSGSGSQVGRSRPQPETSHLRPENHVAWLSLDSEDNSPARFWTYVTAALQTVHADLGQIALQPLRSPQPPPVESILTPLLNQIATFSDRVVLVLDDYHAISTRAIHDGIAFLLEHQPRQLHLVLATRADPPLPIVRLRAHGQLTELRADDLRFTADEAAAFLNETMDLDLLAEDVQALEARTEGWIVGLQLAALSMQDRADAREFVRAFTGGHHYVLEYLTEEVLSRQSQPVQQFLMQTSVLARLCGSLCDAVTETDDGDAMLARLQAGNLFVVPLDDAHCWYRYHHLFADLLHHRLRREASPQQVLELHRRASRWYEEGGLVDEAVKHALAAEDFERVARLAEGAAQASMLDSRLTTLLDWVEALPETVIHARPRLRIYQAWALFLNGHLNRAQQALQDSRQALQNLPPSPENDVLRDELTTLLDTIDLIARGMIYSVDGKLEQAIQTCSRAKKLALEGGHVFLAAHATEGVALAQYHQGRLQESAQSCQQVIDLARRVPAERQAPLAASGYVELAGIYTEWNDLDTAADCLENAVALCRQVGMTQTLCEAYIARSRLRQASGDLDGALEALEQARQVNLVGGSQTVANFRLATQQARLDLLTGRVTTVIRWAHQMTAALTAGGEAGGLLPTAFHEGLQTMLARAHLAQGEADQAIAVLDPLQAPAEAAGSFGHVIEICLLKALAFQAQGNTAAALTQLERSLALAEPEGYVRLYLNEGQPMAALLRLALSHDIAPAYVRQLLSAFGDREYEPKAETPSPTPPHPHRPSAVGPLPEPLTRRELEVLQLICEGCSNREIAEELVIALNTVKRHTSNIYGKLGVKSRTQAVVRARELALLPSTQSG